jgi:hypothetical protein
MAPALMKSAVGVEDLPTCRTPDQEGSNGPGEQFLAEKPERHSDREGDPPQHRPH